MLGPHLPPPPHGLGEDSSTPSTFRIPDGSYRCLALEAEENSGGEEGLQGEAGLMNLEEDRVASRNGDNLTCRATQGAPDLPNALGIQPPSCSREAQGCPQHDNSASKDWDTVKAQQVVIATPRPSVGPRIAQKPGKLMTFSPRLPEPTGVPHSPLDTPQLIAVRRWGAGSSVQIQLGPIYAHSFLCQRGHVRSPREKAL